MDAPSPVELVGERHLVLDRIVERDVQIVGPRAEDPSQTLTDKLHDGVEVKLLGQRLADLVDQVQLGAEVGRPWMAGGR